MCKPIVWDKEKLNDTHNVCIRLHKTQTAICKTQNFTSQLTNRLQVKAHPVPNDRLK